MEAPRAEPGKEMPVGRGVASVAPAGRATAAAEASLQLAAGVTESSREMAFLGPEVSTGSFSVGGSIIDGPLQTANGEPLPLAVPSGFMEMNVEEPEPPGPKTRSFASLKTDLVDEWNGDGLKGCPLRKVEAPQSQGGRPRPFLFLYSDTEGGHTFGDLLPPLEIFTELVARRLHGQHTAPILALVVSTRIRKVEEHVDALLTCEFDAANAKNVILHKRRATDLIFADPDQKKKNLFDVVRYVNPLDGLVWFQIVHWREVSASLDLCDLWPVRRVCQNAGHFQDGFVPEIWHDFFVGRSDGGSPLGMRRDESE